VTDPREGLSDYIRTVRDNTQEYLRDLTRENEKLCALIRTLEGQLDQERRERLQVEERIKTIEAERRSYLERYLDVEAQNDNVSKLYAATLRLHGTISHADVLAAIHEIVINLVGSEELVVFEMNDEGTHLVVSSSFGMEASKLQPIPVGTGIIGQCAVTGRSYIAKATDATSARPERPAEADLTACVPFVVERSVIGAVAIFRLLHHKPNLDPVDFELFKLLGSHAATALYCTSVVASSGPPHSMRPITP
jgi:hypothetical protein